MINKLLKSNAIISKSKENPRGLIHTKKRGKTLHKKIKGRKQTDYECICIEKRPVHELQMFGNPSIPYLGYSMQINNPLNMLMQAHQCTIWLFSIQQPKSNCWEVHHAIRRFKQRQKMVMTGCENVEDQLKHSTKHIKGLWFIWIIIFWL